MRTNRNKKSPLKIWGPILAVLAVLAMVIGYVLSQNNTPAPKTEGQKSALVTQTSTKSKLPDDSAYLKQRFEPLLQVNSETIAYVYAPGTKLDEPVVQTTDNSTYLDKTFEGGHLPEFGTVFMDMDNKKDFSDKLTWLFGHARGSKVPDNRMFNDVNFYDQQQYFDEHPYVVIETPERKFYYEAAFLIIVPETTAFYKTEFSSDEEFVQQLTEVSQGARTKNASIKISKDDHYVVLSTCREEDVTIRSNLYLRQIPDSELEDFLAKHGEKLAYKPTR